MTIAIESHPLPRKGFRNLHGQQFGKLTVIAYNGKTGKNQRSSWLCKCQCGTLVNVTSNNLLQKASTQCLQCKAKAHGLVMSTHRMGKTPTYKAWQSSRDSKRCETWQAFECFFADMGIRPQGTYLCRKDTQVPYCKENCYWGTTAHQKRGSHVIVFNGQTKCLSEWAKSIGISSQGLRSRLKTMTIDMALTASVMPANNRKGPRHAKPEPPPAV